MSSSRQSIVQRIRNLVQRAGLSRRLTFTLLPVVLIPMLALSAVTYFRARGLLQQQATDQMTSAARAQVAVLVEWAETREQRLQLGTQRAELQDSVSNLVLLSENTILYDTARDLVRTELGSLLSREGQTLFSDMLIAQISDGTILVSTNTEWEGSSLGLLSSGEISTDRLDSRPYYNEPLFSPNSLSFLSVAPLRSSGSLEADSILLGVNSELRIGALIEEMQVFWEQRGIYRVERGRTYMLLDPDVIVQLPRYAMIPETMTGQVHPLFETATTGTSGTLTYSNPEGEALLAAYEWIPDWGLGIITELPQADIFAEVNSLAPFTILLLVGVAALVTFLVPLVTGRAVRPLSSLAGFADRIARGDWSSRAPTERQDEVGLLGTAFNRMAEDLSEIYQSLEERVQARTRQIRTASEVARDAVAIRDVETLLNEAVNLITERFGFYHAGVFLVDPTGKDAVLRAASSEGGRNMLARGHKLEVGKVGIVGYVTGTGNPRIAVDVGEDAVHFANPDLPATRSELALPLKSGDTVIGALDVQSTEERAFSEEDVLVLQTMGDQLAVAIENARLIRQTTDLSARQRKVIEVYNRLSQQVEYDQVVKDSTAAVQEIFGYSRVALGIVEGDVVVIRSAAAASSALLPKLGVAFAHNQGPLGKAISSNATVVVQPTNDQALDEPTPGHDRTTIAVPLTSRGNVIGSLAIEAESTQGTDQQDLEILELLAGQIAVSVENARLYEESQQSLEQMDAIYRRQTSEAWEDLNKILSRVEGGTKAQYSGARDPDEVPEDGDTLEAPISLKGEVIGKLDLLGERRRDWSDDDLTILQAVADEVAGALEQMRLLEEIQRRATQLEAAAEVARDATGLLDLETLLQRAVNLLHDRFGFSHIAIFLLEKDDQVAVIREATGEVGRELKNRGHQFLVGSDSIIGFVTQKGEHYIADDTQVDDLFIPNPLLPEIRSELALPLKTGDRVIGALDVQHNAPYSFSQDDIVVLNVLADQVAVAVQNARLFEETLHRAEREQSTLAITSKIRASSDLDDMLRTAVREMRVALGAKRASVRLLQEPILLSIEQTGGDNETEIAVLEP